MEAQDSLNNIGQMYDPHWLEMCDQQNDDSLPQSYRDSVTIEVNKMSMSGEHTKSYTARQDYYCYPNSTAKDSSDATVTTDEDFVPRYTRLVLEAEIKGTLYYYPVSVPNIESNKNYEVSLTITRLGSSHPDIPFYSEDQGFKINIKSWDVKTIGETI